MKVYTIAFQKGGTGKTTTSAALAQAAAHNGKKTLVIDMDAQGNLTHTVGADASKRTSFDLVQGARLASCVQTVGDNLDAIAASRNLIALPNVKGSATALKNALNDARGKYDLVFIDTPATASVAQYNAIYAADGIIFPVTADSYGIQSFYQTLDTVRHLQKKKEIKISGFIIVKANFRSALAKELKERLLTLAQENNVPYLGAVRVGVAIGEAQLLQTDLYKYAPRSNPAKDYQEIYNKIMG